MIPIEYKTGDITKIDIKDRAIIIHCCNNLGLMGAGVALALRKKWPKVYIQYREKYEKEGLELGEVDFVKINKNLVIANMIGQEGIKTKKDKIPISYEAIEECLDKIYNIAKKYNAIVIGPKFGAGLAGGDWKIIEELIIRCLSEKDISVFIYETRKVESL